MRGASTLAEELVDHLAVLREVPAALHQPLAADHQRRDALDAERLRVVSRDGDRLLGVRIVEALEEASYVETGAGRQLELHVAPGHVDAVEERRAAHPPQQLVLLLVSLRERGLQRDQRRQAG